MKFTAATAVVAILASSASAADVRKTSKLRADDTAAAVNRRVEEEDASTDSSEPNWWPKPPEPPEPPVRPGCLPLQTQCFGRQYYQVLTGADLSPPNEATQIEWQVFFDQTPEGCVLAPIHDEPEWRELLAEGRALESGNQDDGAGNPGDMWIGITKAARLVSSGSGSTFDWFNLDGTPVPSGSVITSEYWAGGEPNNDPAGQTRAHLYFSNSNQGLLRDLNPRGNRGPSVNAAIYKCCDDSVVTFTPTSSCNLVG